MNSYMRYPDSFDEWPEQEMSEEEMDRISGEGIRNYQERETREFLEDYLDDRELDEVIGEWAVDGRSILTRLVDLYEMDDTFQVIDGASLWGLLRGLEEICEVKIAYTSPILFKIVMVNSESESYQITYEEYNNFLTLNDFEGLYGVESENVFKVDWKSEGF